ncbi:MAG: hypothetical protein RR444_13660, partial [Oscillospiraceae bacterium]
MQVTTMNDFVKYRSLKIEIARLTRQIPALERQGGTEAADTVKGSSPNFPFVERHYRVIGLINNSAKIEAKKDKLAADMKEEKELRRKLMKFLGTVTDEEIR